MALHVLFFDECFAMASQKKTSNRPTGTWRYLRCAPKERVVMLKKRIFSVVSIVSILYILGGCAVYEVNRTSIASIRDEGLKGVLGVLGVKP